MIAEEAYVLSKSFTKKSLDGQGALKGAPCTIKSITEVDGGQKVTFEWTGTSGTKQTSTMIVKNGVSVTGISDKGNGKFTLLLSDGSESDPIQCVKGEDGFSPTATVEKVGKVATITITDKNGTTTATIKDGEGSEGGEANAIDSISVNGVNVVPDENKNVDITVPSIEGLTKDADLATVAKSGNYEDLSNKPAIPSVEGLAKTTDIPTKVSQLENDSNYLSSIPEEYVTDAELEAKGYLTEHQDISGKVDKVEGKSLISDTEIARLASVDNYDDTDIKAEIAKKADATSIPNKVSVLENDSKYQTESDVTTTLSDYATKTYVGEQIANVEHLKREIVTVLPSDTEASDNIIYMLKVESTVGNDKYQEYMKIDGTVQMVGDTSVDLTDYAKTADVNNSISTLQTDKADASDLTAHTNDADIHVTAENKATWNTVSDKVDKEDGKGLSSNDYTNEEKALVGTIEDKINKTSIVTALDDTVTDEQVASALLAKTELDKKVDKTSISTKLSEESTDDEVVGALTAYNELQKLELANKEQFATASGDYITVTDSVDGNIVELGIKGNSFQQTYRGINLFNCATMFPASGEKNGITLTHNGDGSYWLNGTATDDSQLVYNFNHKDTVNFFKYGAGIYTLSVKDIIKDVNVNAFQCTLYKYDGTNNYYNWNVNSTRKSNSYNITQEILDNENFFIAFMFWVKSGATVNQTFYPQLEFGSEATEYEPYVGGIPSPNPSYPQEIKSVVNPVVRVCGKNLLNPGYHCSGQERYGISVVENSDGSITINGTTTSVAYVNFKFGTSLSNYHKVKKGKYTLSVNGESLSNIAVCVNLYNTSYISVLGSGYITFETDVDYVKALYLKIPEGITFNNNKYYPQLEIGDAATPYEPYKETTAVLPYTLNAIPVDSGGNVTIDGQQYIADYVDFENKKLVKNVGITDLGTITPELVTASGSKIFRYSSLTKNLPPNFSGKSNVIAESYKLVGNVGTWLSIIEKGDNVIGTVSVGNEYGFIIRDSSFTDVNSFKQAMTGSMICYELATPTITYLTDEEAQAFKELATYYPTTNVFVTSDQLNGYAEIKYPTTDVSGLASRNESRIAEIDKNKVDKSSVVTTLGSSSTDTQVPSAKAVWNKSKNKIQRLLDGVDIIVYADSISNELATDTVRIMNATNSPYGVDNVNNDFHYTIYNVNDDKYKRILAYDIRKNDMYMIMKKDGMWGTWAKLATMDKLGGLTFSTSGTTLSITDGTNTWTLEANS